MRFTGRRNSTELKSREMEKKQQTGRGSEASVATGGPPVRDGMTSLATGVVGLADVTGTCMTHGVTSSADDDERSLDENLRPMDGQIWLPDVDGGIADAFQTMVS